MGGKGGVNAGKAIIVGSGPGGSVMAMELAEAGWDVVIFEMGPNYYTNIEGQGPFPTVFSNDELKSQYRYFEQPDPLAYPRTFRQTASQNAANTYVGDVNDLPNQVGGAFPHSDVKVTRMWDIDFKGLSLLGPVPGADMADWPFEYSELAPYYDEVETLIGVQGDVASIPAFVQKHQPQSKPFPMPPGAQMRSSTLLAAGAKRLGLHPFPSRWRPIRSPTTAPRRATTADSAPGYGCPISAKPVNLIMLRRALHTGRAQLRPQTTVTQVNYTGRRATGVSYRRRSGQCRWGKRRRGCAGLLGGLDAASGAAVQLARSLRAHRQTDHVSKLLRRLRYLPQPARARLPRSLEHAGRVRLQRSRLPRSSSLRPAGAGCPTSVPACASSAGSQNPIAEGKFYQEILGFMPGVQFFGRPFKELMRASLLRDRLAGVDCFGTDMPYLTNNVTLDPTIKDLNGQPAPRVTYKIGKFEQVSQDFFIPLLSAMCGASGAQLYAAVPQSTANSFGGTAPPTGLHTMGGMQMGVNPMTSVVDGNGRMHQMDNVFCADGSVFATSGGSNPTNTIMAVALRTARGLTGRRYPSQPPAPRDLAERVAKR